MSCSLAFLRAHLQNLNLTVSPNMSRFDMITEESENVDNKVETAAELM
jgi:hypothetical protein